MSEARRERQRRRLEQEHGVAGLPLNVTAIVGIVAIVAIVALVAGGFVMHQRRERRVKDAFAQCLSTKGAKMYGAYWCPHCADQKERFGSSFRYVDYVECGIKGSRALAQVCTDANIKHFPTWVFADGARVEGDHPLDFLGQETGCALP